MYIVLSLEIKKEVAIATIALGSICRPEVISVTISKVAMGTLPAAAKKLIIPITTNGAMLGTILGKRCLKIRPTFAPTYAPMNKPGAKTPPLPPDAIENEVASIFRNGRSAIKSNGL